MTPTLRTALQNREPTLGHWLSIGHSAVAEILAMANGDFIVIDTEHTPIGLETLQNLIHAIESVGNGTEVLVRLPGNKPIAVKRALDTGATAIMVPMVNSAAEVERFVAAATFPPEGDRGIGGSRATGYGVNLSEHINSADREISLIAQIESETAVENASDIAAVEGIDALFIGPSDLSAAVGTFGDISDEEFVDCIQTVRDAAHDEGIAVGVFEPYPENLKKWRSLDFDYIVAGKDTLHLWNGAQHISEAFDEEYKEMTEPTN
jgi:2-keto-3-deoxy-L-rhamnonate aldolase RhmA